MEETLALVLRGPWLSQMDEQQFLLWLLGRLQAGPPQYHVITLYDVYIDIVLPPSLVS